jgi:hypothetical protein
MRRRDRGFSAEEIATHQSATWGRYWDHLTLAAPAPARELGPAAGARQRAAAGARQRAAAMVPELVAAVGEAALALRAADCLSSDHTEPHQSPFASAVAQPVQKDLRRSALPREEGEEVGARRLRLPWPRSASGPTLARRTGRSWSTAAPPGAGPDR